MNGMLWAVSSGFDAASCWAMLADVQAWGRLACGGSGGSGPARSGRGRSGNVTDGKQAPDDPDQAKRGASGPDPEGGLRAGRRPGDPPDDPRGSRRRKPATSGSGSSSTRPTPIGRTSIDDAGYVTSVAFGQSDGSDPPRPESFVVNLGPTLRRLQAAARLPMDQPLRVTLVAVPLNSRSVIDDRAMPIKKVILAASGDKDN